MSFQKSDYKKIILPIKNKKVSKLLGVEFTDSTNSKKRYMSQRLFFVTKKNQRVPFIVGQEKQLKTLIVEINKKKFELKEIFYLTEKGQLVPFLTNTWNPIKSLKDEEDEKTFNLEKNFFTTNKNQKVPFSLTEWTVIEELGTKKVSIEFNLERVFFETEKKQKVPYTLTEWTAFEEMKIKSKPSNQQPSQSKSFPIHPVFKVPIIDTARPTYIRIETYENSIKPNETVEIENIDFVPHRGAEDLFRPKNHFFLRDKKEYWQFNEMMINGLGRRYQWLIMDDVLMNDPISMKANWQNLKSEEFSSFGVFKGGKSLSIGASPIVIDYQTQDYVASLGYTKIRFLDYFAKATQTDGTFSLNPSERFNIFGNYTIETNEGFFKRGTSTQIMNTPYALNHKVNIRMRYELDSKTYLILSGRYNEFNIVPFGGVDDGEQVIYYTYLQANAKNIDHKTKHSIGNIKAEFIVPTLERLEATNPLKVWGSLSLFNQNYYINEALVDSAFSMRLNAGAKQAFDIGSFKSISKIEYFLDFLDNQNIIQTDIKNSGMLNAGLTVQMDNENLMNMFDLDVAGSANVALYSRYGDQDFHAVRFGFGADANLGLRFLDTLVRTEVFGRLNFSSRLASLEETYNRDSLSIGLNKHTFEDIFMWELGVKLGFSFSSWFEVGIKTSFVQSIISNPIALVKYAPFQKPSEASADKFYHQFSETRMNYTALSAGIDLKIWKISLTASGHYIFDYSILSNLKQNIPAKSHVNFLEYEKNNSNQSVLYLPRWYGQLGLYFRSKLFNQQLDLKIGFLGRGFFEMSSSLKSSERMNEIFFNLYQDDNGFFDNNIETGTIQRSFKGDVQLFAGFQRIVFYVFFEDILSIRSYEIPIYPNLPGGFRFGVSWVIID